MFYNDFDSPNNTSTIKLEDYKELCKFSDQILLSHDANKVTVAIPILHVIREHPIFLKQYESVFNLNNFKKNRVNSGVEFKAAFKYLISVFFNKFFKKKYWLSTKKLEKNYDYVFVSHLLNEKQFSDDKDFYFGDLPELLKSKGFSVLIVLFNHTPSIENLRPAISKNNITKLILTNNNGLFNEIIYFFEFIFESNRLLKKAKHEHSVIKKNLFRLASNQMVSTVNNLRIYYQFLKLSKLINTRSLITTFEGHGWERLIFSAFKKNAPATKCIGYQHAIIFKEQHSIKRQLQSIYNPDLILTSGIFGKNQLSRFLPKIPIQVLGSNRILGSTFLNKNVDQNRSILVIPEAIFSECFLLFEFSLICALKFPNLNFIWRLHPLMNFDQISSQISFRNLPSNIYLSRRLIDEDIQLSKWVLYRGSTAVLNAVISGLRPIYLALKDELSIDPLYQFDNWKKSIYKPNDLFDLIREEEASEVLDCQVLMMNELKNYVCSFNVDVLIKNSL